MTDSYGPDNTIILSMHRERSEIRVHVARGHAFTRARCKLAIWGQAHQEPQEKAGKDFIHRCASVDRRRLKTSWFGATGLYLSPDPFLFYFDYQKPISIQGLHTSFFGCWTTPNIFQSKLRVSELRF